MSLRFGCRLFEEFIMDTQIAEDVKTDTGNEASESTTDAESGAPLSHEELLPLYFLSMVGSY